MKKCGKCQNEKDPKEFARDRSQPDGLRFYCKACTAEITRASHIKKHGIPPTREVRRRVRARLAEMGIDVCAACHTPKPTSEFSRARLCKDCRNERKRRYRAKTGPVHFEEFEHVDSKVCLKCKVEKPRDSFHKDPSQKTGLRVYCRECVSEYYDKNAERLIERSKKWNRQNPEKARRAVIDHKKRHPDRARARQLVIQKKRAGRIPPASDLQCVDCGGKANSYHHEDYSKPLDVVPLCHRCHGIRHRKRG